MSLTMSENNESAAPQGEPQRPNSTLSDKEIKKLRDYVSYGDVWPAFFAIGMTFLILGIQGNNAFLAVGVTFTILSATWFGSATSSKKKLEAHGIPLKKEEEDGS